MNLITKADIASNMKYAGVDGCYRGWFGVSLTMDHGWEFKLFSTVQNLWQEFQDASLILIDIPIGLPDVTDRLCDVAARKLLARRKSSIFSPPARESLFAENFQQACMINKKILGKKISLQAWNISPKIKEVDAFLDDTPGAKAQIRESHPEICFWALAGGHTLEFSKKTEPGIQERLAILNAIQPDAEHIFYAAVRKYRRNGLAKDDILDAIALAITSSSPVETLCTLPKNPEKDKLDLPMEIVYTNRYLS